MTNKEIQKVLDKALKEAKMYFRKHPIRGQGLSRYDISRGK